MKVHSSYRTLGVRVDAVQIPDVIGQIQSWIAERGGCHYIAVTGMHGVTEAQSDEGFKEILNDADLVVPDGMPLVWLARRNGLPIERRVYGPELMETFLEQTGATYRHFLYGGAEGVADRLAGTMRERFDSNVVGVHCPPFRDLTPDEDGEIVELINGAKPDVVWVGLSTPKQEQWMHAHKDRLEAPVLIGVGAAFDFLAGMKPSAPHWMQEHGLEWLYRLAREPRRLWRRYLVGGAKFLWLLALETLKLRRSRP